MLKRFLPDLHLLQAQVVGRPDERKVSTVVPESVGQPLFLLHT
jgi:hypothetical protein